jgi:hypothetical protein
VLKILSNCDVKIIERRLMYECVDGNSKQQPLWIQVLRWLVLIPAVFIAKNIVTLVGSLILAGVIYVYYWLTNPDPDEGNAFLELLWPMAIHGLSCWAFIFLGALIAPNYKNIVAYVLAGFLIICTVGFAFIVLLAGGISLAFSLEVLGSLIGACAAIPNVKECY